MLQKLGQGGLWKLFVYFLYLCGQVLILGTLMVTTQNMVAHSLVMLLTIALYFAVCLKDPGVYYANPQPNLEDISNHHVKKGNGGKEKKIVSEQIRQEMEDVILEPQPAASPPPKAHKKTSIQKRVVVVAQWREGEGEGEGAGESSLRVPSANTLQAKTEGNIVASAKNMFSAARNVIGNITGFMSKKNLDRPSMDRERIEPPQPKSERSIRVQGEGEGEGGQPYTINVINSPPQQTHEDKQECCHPHEQQSEQQQMPAVVAAVPRGKDKVAALSAADRMVEKRRYCRICQFYQPLRVRHCHSCEQCISTFDHHCPWLSTCIGEKNKLSFIGYLFAQTLQFLVVAIDLISNLSDGGNKAVGILLLAVLLILIVLVLLLGFHIYLAVTNLTTWQLFRWGKIEYLSIFDKQLLSSPFSKGWRQNLNILWTATVQQEAIKWQESISPSLQQFLVKGKGEGRKAAASRKLFLSQGNL